MQRRNAGSEQSVRYGRIPRPAALTGERRFLRRLYGWAFLSRVLAGLSAYAVTFYVDVPIIEDAHFYEEIGYEMARSWLSGRDVDFAALAPGADAARLLVTVIAVFYYVFDGVRALPALLIVYGAVTALVPLYVYRISQELQLSDVAARRAGWLVALSPVFVFWSGSLYKEGIVLLILSVATYHTLRLQSRWHAWSMISVALCILGLWGVRYYLAVLLMLAVAVSLTWGRIAPKQQPLRLPVLMRQSVIVAGFLLMIIMLGVYERTERVLVESDRGLLIELDVRRAGSAREAASGYLQDARIATSEEALQYFPVGLFYFLTVPFPWQVGALRQNLIIPENVFWLMLYPLVLVGITRTLRLNRPGAVFVLLMTAGTCAIYALLSANIGTTYRMRSQVWLLWAPFAAAGWEALRERHHRRRAVTIPQSRSAMTARYR